MPNRNRQAGDYFERRAQDALEAAGWVVTRAAGSLGPADLVALKSGNRPMLISCKVRGSLPRQELVRLVDTAHLAGAAPILAHRHRPGWVALDLVEKHQKTRIGQLHCPPRTPPVTGERDGLHPPGEQLYLT